MKISVTHVITTIDMGGAEKQLLSLASFQIRTGYEVEVIFLKDIPLLKDEFESVGVKVNHSLSQLSFLRQCQKLRELRSGQSSVFHAHLPRAEILCAIALRKKSFIVTRHNTEAFFPKGPSMLSRRLSRFVLRRAFACISISNAVSDFLKMKKEIPSGVRHHVIYYGLKDLDPLYLKRFPAQKRHIRIGTIARLVPQKNLPLAIHAIKLLNVDSSIVFSLDILGKGPLLKQLEALVKSLGLQNLVSFQGITEDIENFYDSLDLFVLTSNYEGFGLVLLEAMTFGVPILSRNVSAIPEVLGEKHPGLLNSNYPSDLAERIRQIVFNAQKWEECLKFQSVRLKKFSIEVSHNSYQSIYLDLITSRVLEAQNIS